MLRAKPLLARADSSLVSAGGVLGIGYPSNEALAHLNGTTYPNLPQALVNGGFIKASAYSLWLNGKFEHRHYSLRWRECRQISWRPPDIAHPADQWAAVFRVHNCHGWSFDGYGFGQA